jgi:hypothetical protein
MEEWPRPEFNITPKSFCSNLRCQTGRQLEVRVQRNSLDPSDKTVRRSASCKLRLGVGDNLFDLCNAVGGDLGGDLAHHATSSEFNPVIFDFHGVITFRQPRGFYRAEIARKLSSLPCPLGTTPTCHWQKSSLSACQNTLPSLATKAMIARPSGRQLPLKEKTCIPARSNRTTTVPFSATLYRRRHRVENFFEKIKRYRRVATRQAGRNFPWLCLPGYSVHPAPHIDDLQTRP